MPEECLFMLAEESKPPVAITDSKQKQIFPRGRKVARARQITHCSSPHAGIHSLGVCPCPPALGHPHSLTHTSFYHSLEHTDWPPSPADDVFSRELDGSLPSTLISPSSPLLKVKLDSLGKQRILPRSSCESSCPARETLHFPAGHHHRRIESVISSQHPYVSCFDHCRTFAAA